MQKRLGMPLAECKYGWGRVLRLYYDGLDIEGAFYPLSDLVQVYPTYCRVAGFSVARLELQFKRYSVVIRGIADVPLAQKIVDYITRWNAVTEAMSASTAFPPGATSESGLRPSGMQPVPRQDDFWEYSEQRRAVPEIIVPTGSMPIMPRSGLRPEEAPQLLPASVLKDINAIEPWPAMPESERAHRLKRLQAERELHIYGFDVQMLDQRLCVGPMPIVLAPLRLLAGETAHYSTEANVCAEVDPTQPDSKRRVKDRGKLILTNKRFIYLGQKRQIIYEYERFWQLSHLPGAIALIIEGLPTRQLFETRHSFECALYLKRLLEDTELERETLHCQYGQVEARQVTGTTIACAPGSFVTAYKQGSPQSELSRGRETIKLARQEVARGRETIKLARQQLEPAGRETVKLAAQQGEAMPGDKVVGLITHQDEAMQGGETMKRAVPHREVARGGEERGIS